MLALSDSRSSLRDGLGGGEGLFWGEHGLVEGADVWEEGSEEVGAVDHAGGEVELEGGDVCAGVEDGSFEGEGELGFDAGEVAIGFVETLAEGGTVAETFFDDGEGALARGAGGVGDGGVGDG